MTSNGRIYRGYALCYGVGHVKYFSDAIYVFNSNKLERFLMKICTSYQCFAEELQQMLLYNFFNIRLQVLSYHGTCLKTEVDKFKVGW